MELSYILEKINQAKFSNHPFKHVEIHNLFKEEDFKKIIQSQEVGIEAAKNDKDLFNKLFAKNYRIINFPGCTTDYKKYIKWHKDKKRGDKKIHSACEGYGVVLRLDNPKSPKINILKEFINSTEFIDCIAKKFNIKNSECDYDSGIQKYLDGYEISPHPDIRQKALTFMININPNPASSEENHHTSYLQFKPKKNYIKYFWKGNKNIDRCWVPWDWCETKTVQKQNNSLVIFSPDNDTIHAVKADYNHLLYQRTQLYGNLWFKESLTEGTPQWK
jgi:hypothetical protein